MNTIADVAQEAGVSVATVSRVMNGSGLVSRETEDKVRSAVERLGYQPNAWGRNLRKGESRMLLLLIPNATNPFYAGLISGVEDTAREAGYSAMLCITQMDDNRRGEYLSLLRSGRADGAILMDAAQSSSYASELSALYPTVQCCEFSRDEKLSHVSIDNYSAARDVMHYLVSLGHRQIGLVSADNEFCSTYQRREGYGKALMEAGVGVRGDYTALADRDYGFRSGVQAAGSLLDLPERPTALFCTSDVLALAALRAAADRGLSVPGDLSVVGFDDVEYATMFHPTLTTVRQPCYDLGQMACRILLQQIDGEPAGTHCFLPHKMLVRESTDAWRGGAVGSSQPSHMEFGAS